MSPSQTNETPIVSHQYADITTLPAKALAKVFKKHVS